MAIVKNLPTMQFATALAGPSRYACCVSLHYSIRLNLSGQAGIVVSPLSNLDFV